MMKSDLTPRMKQAADLVRQGKSNSEIARVMGIKCESAKSLVKATRQRIVLPMRNRWTGKK